MKNPNDHLFRFCPLCGKKNLIVAGEKSFHCHSCSFKFYLNTAAAGMALIFNDSNELLITKRKNDPAKGTLDFPGGFAEPGETIENCLTREVKEELNLDIVSLNYFCSVPNTYIYKSVTYTITDFAFVCRVDNFKPIKACDDVLDFEFIPMVRIDKTLFGLESPKVVITKLQKTK